LRKQLFLWVTAKAQLYKGQLGFQTNIYSTRNNTMNTLEQSNTPAFYFLAWASFAIASISMLIGIVFLPTMAWIKGFLAMGYLFTVTTCFTLAKTIRDKHEEQRLINRVKDAQKEFQKTLLSYF